MRDYTRENDLRSTPLSKQWYTRQFYRKKDNAKRRGISFDLSREDFIELYKVTDCYYCLKPLDTFITLDRLDNDEGYTLDNCAISCNQCNAMKGTLPLTLFKQLRPLFIKKARVEKSIKLIMENR